MFQSSKFHGFLLFAAALLFCVPTLLSAQSTSLDLGPKTTGVYYGIATGQVEYAQDFQYQDFGFTAESRDHIEVNTIELRTGVSYNRWISLEARLGSGSDGSTDIGYSDTEASLDVGAYQNFFLKLKYPSYIQPYGLIGMSHTDTKLCQEGAGCESSIDWRPTYGIGVLLPLRGDFTTGLYAEALNYKRATAHEDRFDADIEQFNFGLMMGF